MDTHKVMLRSSTAKQNPYVRGQLKEKMSTVIQEAPLMLAYLVKEDT